jgi:hypothetical protein
MNDEMREMFPDALLLDGFEEALLGLGSRFTHDVAIYDYGKCVDILVERDGMTEEEAVEYIEFNTAGAYVGESTPILLRRYA